MTARHVHLAVLAAELRKAGATVVIESGAQGLAARAYPNGYPRGCQAMVLHHTASSGLFPKSEIKYIRSGRGQGVVIADAYISRGGVIHLIASGPTYTEGSGGPYGIIPRNGANAVCFSVEIANRGNGKQKYPRKQARAVHIWNAVVPPHLARVFGWPDDPWAPHRLFTHFEWTSRKIDCFGPVEGYPSWSNGGKWIMNAVRQAGRALWNSLNSVKPPPPPAPTPPPADKGYVSVGTGRYTMQQDDSPWSVSEFVYGTGSRYPELQAANPDARWWPGEIITCPGIPGRTRKVEHRDTPLGIIRIMFPDADEYALLDDFWKWNGGERTIHPGEWVYLPV